MTNSLQNLPPEMQARLAAIMSGKQQDDPALQAAAAAAVQMQSTPTPQVPQQQAPVSQQVAIPPTPPQKPSSLIDILVALRTEIGLLRQEVNIINKRVEASSLVNEAVGRAVADMYQMFRPSENSAAPNTYSQTFQQQQAVEEASDY